MRDINLNDSTIFTVPGEVLYTDHTAVVSFILIVPFTNVETAFPFGLLCVIDVLRGQLNEKLDNIKRKNIYQ